MPLSNDWLAKVGKHGELMKALVVATKAGDLDAGEEAARKASKMLGDALTRAEEAEAYHKAAATENNRLADALKALADDAVDESDTRYWAQLVLDGNWSPEHGERVAG